MRESTALLCLLCFMLLPFLAGAQPYDEKGNFALEAENFYIQGAARQDTGELETAANFYAEATAADPLHLKSWFNLGLVQYKLGNFKEAESALEKLLELAPDDIGAYELYGLILYQLGHFDRAIASYNLVIQAGPNDVLHVNRALAYLATGRNKPALQDFGEALRLNPGNLNACLGKGIALSELGQSQLAIEWFNRALELQPGHPATLSNRAIAHFQTGEREKAMDDFRAALARSKAPSIFTARARCFLSAGNPDEAWYDVKEALHLSPGSPELFELLGEIEWERGNHEAAIESFSKALEADPKRSSCYFKRSKILVQNHRFYDAASDLYRVIEMDPFNQEAKAMLLNTYSQIDRENLSSMATK